MILLDTNVISEIVKATPNPSVIAWLETLPPDETFTAAICEAEIHYGLARLPAGRRRDELTERVAALFDTGFRDQVLCFDRPCAVLFGEIRHAWEASGRPIAVVDAMIAATARAHGASAIATRNTKDFDGCGIALIDPWLTA